MISGCSDMIHVERAHLGCQSHAARYKKTTVCNACCHHTELVLLDEANEVLDLLLELGVFLVLGDIRVGSLVTGVCVGERHVSRCC